MNTSLHAAARPARLATNARTARTCVQASRNSPGLSQLQGLTEYQAAAGADSANRFQRGVRAIRKRLGFGRKSSGKDLASVASVQEPADAWAVNAGGEKHSWDRESMDAAQVEAIKEAAGYQ
ncbi:unnamed protein product [Pedinophyceae sp. YPF-701]|nr:unnamed protein product [Pedinophyceae sp. YPF-701]